MCKDGKGKSTKPVNTFKAKGNKLQKSSGQHIAYVSLTQDEYDMKSLITMQCYKEAEGR